MTEKVVVIGTGYVGLPLAIMLARSDYEVVGVDVEKTIVHAINEGVLHLAEDEIRQIFNEPRVRENLHASSTPCEADIFIISVPTPLDNSKEAADLSQVINGIESIVPWLRKGNLVIIESTIPPLTCRNVVAPMLAKTGLKIGDDIHLCHCPERILPGRVFDEIVHNDRVIGGLDKKAAEMARDIYSTFVKGNLFITDDVTAELVKLMENTYRDINIALANELGAVAEGLGVNIKEAIKLANMHPRVHILNPGIGAGGHCIPVDPIFIRGVDPVNSRLINTARQINDGIPAKITSKIIKAVSSLKNPEIVALGVTYKPDTYDIRNSPALEIIELLEEAGFSVTAYDPLAEGYSYSTVKEAAEGADCLVVLVEHQAIRDELESNETEIKSVMRNPLIIRF